MPHHKETTTADASWCNADQLTLAPLPSTASKYGTSPSFLILCNSVNRKLPTSTRFLLVILTSRKEYYPEP